MKSSKKLLLTICVLSAFTSANAQNTSSTTTSTNESVTEDEGTIIVNPFNKNWQVGFSAGTQAYLGEYSITDFKVKDWFSPSFDLSIEKWASPYFSVGLATNFSLYKGLYGTGDYTAVFAKSGDSYYGDTKRHKFGKGSYLNPYIYGSADMTNLIWGYRSDRAFHIIASVGGGVAIATSDVLYRSVAPTFNASLRAQLQLNKQLAIQVSARGGLVGDDFNGIDIHDDKDMRNRPADGLIGITAGVAYKFGFVNKNTAGTSKASAKYTGYGAVEWVPMMTAYKNTETYTSELEKAHTEGVAEGIEETKEHIEAQQKIIAEQAEKIEELKEIANENSTATVDKSNIGPYRQYVNFAIDKYDITERERVNVMLAAEMIKANPGIKFSVCGYADKQTAKPDHNLTLSKNRAEAVADCLVNQFNVDPSQIVVSYEGGVDFMFFEKEYLSRSVLICVSR